MQVIFNGIDIPFYEKYKDGCIIRENIGIPKDAFIIGMVGRLCEQKAPDIFIQMANKVKEQISNAYFIFVGDGELKNKIEQYAKEHKLFDSIYITGWIDNPMSYIKLFDVAVLLSRWEGFGLVIPEYMIARKPIVATAVDAIPNLITDSVNGLLISVDDPDAACNAVMELYSNLKLRNKLMMQAIKDVYEKYDIRRVVTEHEELFENLME